MERGYFVWAAKMGLDGGSVVGKWKSLLLLNYDVYARFSFNLAIIKMCQPRLILPTGKLLTISQKKNQWMHGQRLSNGVSQPLAN